MLILEPFCSGAADGAETSLDYRVAQIVRRGRNV